MISSIISIFPAICVAATIGVTDLLSDQASGDTMGNEILASTKTVMFQQSASSGTDATSIAKITLAFFTANNCSGTSAGSGFYTTPDGTSYPISVGTPFGLVAASTWNIGSTQLSIADMTTILSVAVTFKSSNNNTPQTNFSGLSYACIPVSCTAGECISTSATQSFSLKTTAAVGDPADGGVIGCQNSGSSFNLFNLVVSISDSTPQVWGGSGITTGATSTTDGAANTSTIVTALGLGTYAARTCSTYSAAGGFSSGWFLPSGNGTNTQLNCLYNNKTAIATGAVAAGGAGYVTGTYWSSTEASSTTAWDVSFSSGASATFTKRLQSRFRCTRAY